MAPTDVSFGSKERRWFALSSELLIRYNRITFDACLLSIKRLTAYISHFQPVVNDLLVNKSVTLENEA